ncbi:hypothetical protein GCM10022403_044810 [Streptomyces coacervatus]|uniref:Uncharacterized protein n=1 Tax=Streptomyces coacervatus TaxID=647381 RepID=A0ABP7HYG2_9ACTN
MPASRLVTTACPIPAEARTTTERVVAARITQRGFLRGTGGRGPRGSGVRAGWGRRCGGAGAADRGWVGKADTSGRRPYVGP